MDKLDKEMIHIQDRIDFIMLLRMVLNLKLINYFWNFPLTVSNHN